MIVSIDNILKLIKFDTFSIKLIPINDIGYTPAGMDFVRLWKRGEEIPRAKIQQLKEDGAREIDLYFSSLLYKSLVVCCPENFRNPSSVKSLFEIDRIITTFENINRTCKRKRYISFLYELYGPDYLNEDPIIRYEEPVDFHKWNAIKRSLKKNAQLPVLFSERGIIVFVDLTNKSDLKYIERFKINTDICTILTQRKPEYANFSFSPDFNTMTDIWTVNNPDDLLDTYIQNNAKLIILGDKLNEYYKSALLKVKRYDKYARFIVTTDVIPENPGSLLNAIKKAYNKDNYTFA